MSTKRLDLSLILACYNEEPVFRGSIKRIVETLDQSRLTYEIIFVDDASGDATKQLIATAIKKYPQSRALYHQKNAGRGATVTDGFRAAIGTVVGYIDFDLEVSPIYISEMVSLILQNKADCVLGKRIYRSSWKRILREVYSYGYQKVADWMIGTGGLDTESGYKFFRRTKVLPLLTQATHPHWFWDTEIMVYARLGQLKIIEVPVLFLRRFDKVSSVRVFRDITDYIISLWKFRQTLQKR